jgi:uncharacterized protein YcfL
MKVYGSEQQTEVSSEFEALAALVTRKESMVSIGYEAWWADHSGRAV